MSRRWWILVLAVGVVGLLAGCSSSLTDNQAKLKPQDYGAGQQYQVEISLNCTSKQNCLQAQLPPGVGYGVWLWLELNSDGSGDYTGSDCAHHLGGDTGAFSAAGDLTWTDDGSGNLVIDGVVLINGAAPVRITVPSKLGHHVLDGADVFDVLSGPFAGVPLTGTTQVQVAP